MQATRARFFRSGMNNQWGYVKFETTLRNRVVLRCALDSGPSAYADTLQLRHERKPSSPLPATFAET